jgi:hypothetical protein
MAILLVSMSGCTIKESYRKNLTRLSAIYQRRATYPNPSGGSQGQRDGGRLLSAVPLER